jgi:hypothetical protein
MLCAGFGFLLAFSIVVALVGQMIVAVGVTGPAFSGLLPVAAGQLITVTQGNEPYAIGSHAQR